MMNTTKENGVVLKVQCSALPQIPAVTLTYSSQSFSSSSFPKSEVVLGLKGGLDSSTAYEEKLLQILKIHSNPSQLSDLNKGLSEVLPKAPAGSVPAQQTIRPQAPQMSAPTYPPRAFAPQPTMAVNQPTYRMPVAGQPVYHVARTVMPSYPTVAVVNYPQVYPGAVVYPR